MTELRITIAGHMNHGKTSIVRTLTDNITFGEVGIRHSTINVSNESYKLGVFEGSLIIFDTPGLERASEALAAIPVLNEKQIFCEVVNYFKAPKEGEKEEFDLELATLEHIQSGPDVILYVVRLNQPLTKSYKDEYTILRKSGVPVLPIFNFVGCKNSSKQDWTEFLKFEGCRDCTDYDAHIWDPDNEKRLWDRVKAQMQDKAKEELVEAWRDNRLNSRKKKDEKAASAIVNLLEEVSKVKIEWREEPADDGKEKVALEDLHRGEFERKVSEIEVEKLNLILDAYKLNVGKIADAINSKPILKDGNPTVNSVSDLFGKTVLKDFGLKLAAGIAACAGAGALIGMAFGGIGSAPCAIVGGLIGGFLGSGRAITLSCYDKKTFTKTIMASTDLLSVVLCRALALTRDLRRRGFANDHEPNLASAKFHMPPDAKPFLEKYFNTKLFLEKYFNSSNIKSEEHQQQVLRWIQQPFPE